MKKEKCTVCFIHWPLFFCSSVSGDGYIFQIIWECLNFVLFFLLSGPNERCNFQSEDTDLTELKNKLLLFYHANACTEKTCADLSQGVYEGQLCGTYCGAYDLKVWSIHHFILFTSYWHTGKTFIWLSDKCTNVLYRKRMRGSWCCQTQDDLFVALMKTLRVFRCFEDALEVMLKYICLFRKGRPHTDHWKCKLFKPFVAKQWKHQWSSAYVHKYVFMKYAGRCT